MPLFTGPYEVEEDLTHSEITARRREDDRDLTARLKAHALAGLVADADELLARNPLAPQDVIAHRLGLTPNVYRERIQPHTTRPTQRDEQTFLAVLDRLIANGQPFTVDALPSVGDETGLRCRNLLAEQQRAGRILPGKRTGRDGGITWHPQTPAVAA